MSSRLDTGQCDGGEDAEAARRVAERAGRKIPALVELVEPLLRQAGLNPARTVDAWGRCLRVLLGVRRTLDRFSPDVYDHNLSDLIAATGSAEYRREHGVDMGMFERNRYKKAAREFLRPGSTVDDMHAALRAVAEQRAELREIAGRDIRPQIPRGLLEADELHQEIDEYNRQGIAIQYVAFPRMGPASEDFRTMEAVWCADDRKQALTDAKSGKTVPSRRCTNPVAMQYALGQQLGVNGTPAIFAPDGTQLGGYLPPAQLRAALEKLSAKR